MHQYHLSQGQHRVSDALNPDRDLQKKKWPSGAQTFGTAELASVLAPDTLLLVLYFQLLLSIICAEREHL